jgi:uncharacterized protein Smg (DUF494 family)
VTQVETLKLPSLYDQRLFNSASYLLYLRQQQIFYQQTSDLILDRINHIIETTDLVDAEAIENLEQGLWEIGGALLRIQQEISRLTQQIAYEQ